MSKYISLNEWNMLISIWPSSGLKSIHSDKLGSCFLSFLSKQYGKRSQKTGSNCLSVSFRHSECKCLTTFLSLKVSSD